MLISSTATFAGAPALRCECRSSQGQPGACRKGPNGNRCNNPTTCGGHGFGGACATRASIPSAIRARSSGCRASPSTAHSRARRRRDARGPEASSPDPADEPDPPRELATCQSAQVQRPSRRAPCARLGRSGKAALRGLRPGRGRCPSRPLRRAAGRPVAVPAPSRQAAPRWRGHVPCRPGFLNIAISR